MISTGITWSYNALESCVLCCKSPAHLYVRDEEQKNNETLLLGTHFGTECKFFFRRRLYSFLDLRNILVRVKAREKSTKIKSWSLL